MPTREAQFGYDLPTDLPYPIVAKTGTAEGFADTVAIFATKEFVVGAWVGRQDGRPTQGLSGMQGAARAARIGLQAAAQGNMLSLPAKPEKIVRREVCALSGLSAHEGCTKRRSSLVTSDHEQTKSCDWHNHAGKTHYPEKLASFHRRKHSHLRYVTR